MIVTGADAGREGNTLLELADLAQLRVEASVNEIDVAVLTLGMPVEITFESVPEAKASGRITFIAPAAGKSAGGGNRAAAVVAEVAARRAISRCKSPSRNPIRGCGRE
jgi:multidrug resistance efflux pump